MSSISKILLIVFSIFTFMDRAVAEPAACTPSCDEPKQLTIREQIKVDREKYDRENVQTTARPWDGLNLGRADTDKKQPVTR